MNDSELQQHLKALIIPAPAASARGRARYRAGVAFGATAASPASKNWPWRGVFIAALSILIVAGVIDFGAVAKGERARSAAAWQTLRQMEAVFPGQVDAVVEHDGQVAVELAERSAPSSDQPLLVQLRRGGKIWKIISYSGRQVHLELEGQSLWFEVLLTPEGRVILAGSDFLWTSSQSGTVAGCQVSAGPLSPAS